MATIVNTPPAQSNDSSNSITGLIGLVLVIATILFVVYLLLPILRRGVSTPSVSVPDKIDVNVNTPNQ